MSTFICVFIVQCTSLPLQCWCGSHWDFHHTWCNDGETEGERWSQHLWVCQRNEDQEDVHGADSGEDSCVLASQYINVLELTGHLIHSLIHICVLYMDCNGCDVLATEVWVAYNHWFHYNGNVCLKATLQFVSFWEYVRMYIWHDLMRSE